MNKILFALRHWAQQAPNKAALVGLDHHEQPYQLSYAELWHKVQQTSEKLKALNITSLALRSENSLYWAIIDLAAMHARTVVVPVPTFFSEQQVLHTLEQSDIDALIGDWSTIRSDALQALGVQISTPEYLVNLPVYRRTSNAQHAYLSGTGKITFTSGSTGQPKGVCLSHEHISIVTQSLADCVNGIADTHLVLLPLSTLLENITGIYVPILLGATSHILPGQRTGLMGSSQFDPQRFAQTLAIIQPESLVLTPALLLALIHVAKLQPALVKSLKFVAVGGARVSSQLIQTAHALGIPAFEGYGLSECGSVVCLNTPASMKAGSCGKPLPHSEVRIAEDGELLVKGNVALGYLHEPFQSEWLATGDLAQMDEQGFITLSGRKKNLIVTAYGRNISPEWIESEALALLPMTPLIITGDGEQALCAVVRNTEDVRNKVTQLNALLPDYARIRTLLLLENPNAIPHWYTDNGKVKRNEVEASVKQLLESHGGLSLAGQSIERIDLPFSHPISA